VTFVGDIVAIVVGLVNLGALVFYAGRIAQKIEDIDRKGCQWRRDLSDDCGE
jgi:hypothetical protein